MSTKAKTPAATKAARNDSERLQQLREEAGKVRFRAAGMGAMETDGTHSVTMSTEAIVDYGWYKELLRHEPGCVNLTRAAKGLSYLADHDRAKLIGRVEQVALGADKKLHGVARMAPNPLAQEIRGDIAGGFRPGGSIGYNYIRWHEEKRDDGLYLVADEWEPVEYSSVTVEADIAAGPGRAQPRRDTAMSACCEGCSCGDGCNCCTDGVCGTGCDCCPCCAEKTKQMSSCCDGCTCDAGCGCCTGGDCGADCDCCPNCAVLQRSETNKNSGTPPITPAAPGRQENAMTPDEKAAQEAATRAAAAGGTTPPNPAKLALDLSALAQRHKAQDKLHGWLERGVSLEQAKTELLEREQAGTRALEQPGSEDIDLSDKDRSKYSYARAMAAAAGIAEKKNVSGFEVDISQELGRKMPMNFQRRGGLLIPLSLRRTSELPASGQRTTPLNTQAAGAGAELVYAQYGGEVIELLRNQSAVLRMGARLLSGLGGPVSFPKQTGAASSIWIGENPASAVAESEATFGHALLSPKTLQAKSLISRQLLVEATPDVESMVREDLALVHALAWDLAAIHGLSASNQPTGIYNITGVATEGFSGAPTYAHLLNMAKKIATANAMLGTLGFLTNPAFASEASGILRFSVNGSKQLWEGPILEGNMIDYKAIATNQVSSTMSTLVATGGSELGCIFGNWRDLIIGQFGGAVEILVDPYTYADSGLIRYISFQMVDILARHPASFCVATGAT